MPAYKTPDFAERTAAARQAKQTALEKLRARPEPDPAVVAARQAAQAARETAAADKREAKRAAAEAEAERIRAEEERLLLEAEEAAEAARVAEAERIAEAERVAIARRAMTRPELTAEERKAARDARYAARKERQR